MKRVMSAPVGASRVPQQQLASVSSSTNIGTAAFSPRSSNVALDAVIPPPSPLHVHAFTPPSFRPRLFASNAVRQFQPGARGGNIGSIYGKTPGSAQGMRDRSAMGGAGGAGRGR